MPALATIKRAPQWVSYGPPNTDGGASDWCRLSTGTRDSWYQDHAAPGGIILCKRDTAELHPEAKRYAREAWAAYGRYIAALHPELAKDWAPTPIVETGNRKCAWERTTDYVVSSKRSPGNWVLRAITPQRTYFHPRAEYFAELEWSRFAKAHAGQTRTDNTKLISNGWHRPDCLNPLPVLTDADVRNANKYTRRAITTKADRIAAEKIIKRPVAAGAA